MSTFVVTGATGFIGRKLAESLAMDWIEERYKHKVVVLVRDGAPPNSATDVVRGELEDLRTCERLIAEYQPDGVFHLAAQAIVGIGKRDPFNTLESNVRGTYNLLEAFRRHRKEGSRMVVASSDKAYGELPAMASAYTEDMPLEGRGPYDVSKTCADLIAQSYGITYGLPIAIIRAGNVYGPGDDDLSRIIPSLCDDVIHMRPLTIRSDGTPIREYLHVWDVVKGYRAAYEKNDLGGRAYNLGTGVAFTVKGVAEVFFSMLEKMSREPTDWMSHAYTRVQSVKTWLWKFKDNPIEILGTRTGEIQRQVLDPARAWNELRWGPNIQLIDGLRDTFMDAWHNRPS
jgi:CDP-glucose 4,6-dehydratase